MSGKTGQYYEFGSFCLVPHERLLLHEGKPVPLPPKTFDVLLALVRNGGRLLEKSELMQAVWPDTFVEEGNLALNISNLRKALSDGRDGRAYIETVPKRGYRFVAPIVVGGASEHRPEPRSRKIGWLVAAAILATMGMGWSFWHPLRAVNRDGPEARELMVRGKYHALRSGTGEMELARDLLSQSIRLDPNSADAHSWLAYTLHNQYRVTMGSDETLEDAVMHARKALALDPKSIVARHTLIHMADFILSAEEALRLGREVLAADPGNLDAIAAAAEGYFRAGMLDKAISLFEKVILADPGRGQVRQQLVRALLFRGDYERGIEIAFERGDRDAGSVWTMLHYKELGRFQEAMNYAASDFKTLNGYFEWYMAGCVFQAAGEESKAREVWTEGARRVESLLAVREHRSARSFLGIMYAKLGLREPALEQARRLLATRPESPYVLFFVAKLQAILGNRREALDCLRRAIDRGFLMAPFLHYHARPALGLYSLRDDPEFLALRDGLDKKIKLLESSVR